MVFKSWLKHSSNLPLRHFLLAFQNKWRDVLIYIFFPVLLLVVLLLVVYVFASLKVCLLCAVIHWWYLPMFFFLMLSIRMFVCVSAAFPHCGFDCFQVACLAICFMFSRFTRSLAVLQFPLLSLSTIQPKIYLEAEYSALVSLPLCQVIGTNRP